jgi:S-adenosylmethionine decarboxylase
MLIKELHLQNYLFNNDVLEFSPKERLEITNRLRREMIEIYTGMNVYE